MKDMILWQRDTELMAEDIYREISQRFQEDEVFAGFVAKLANDERGHARIMEKVLAFFEERGEFPVPDLVLDEKTSESVIGSIERCRRELAAGSVAKNKILEYIVQAEFLEWNDIFIYILMTSQQYSSEFQKMSAVIQHHRQRVEDYLAEAGIDLTDLAVLPPIWEAKFLIVDDDPLIRLFLGEELKAQASVETAENGQMAFEMARQNYFDLIISDIDMPEMNGMEFLAELKKADPEVAARFAFCTGDPGPEVSEFCKQNHIRHILEKPFPLHQLMDTVKEIMAGA